MSIKEKMGWMLVGASLLGTMATTIGVVIVLCSYSPGSRVVFQHINCLAVGLVFSMLCGSVGMHLVDKAKEN